MNLFVLLGKAETKLETGDDPYFNAATELVTSILLFCGHTFPAVFIVCVLIQ